MQHVPVTILLRAEVKEACETAAESERRALSAYLRNLIEDAVRPERRKSREGAGHGPAQA